MKSLPLLLALTWIFPAWAQDEIRIEFPDTLYTTPKAGSGIMPTFEYTGDTIFYRGKPYVIKLPDHLQNESTSWGLEYFTGREEAAIKSNVLIVIESYKDKSPKIYVDYNGNLDLTDDGAPLTPDTASKTCIYLFNSVVPKGQFGLKISPASYYNEKSRKSTEDFFMNHSNGRGNKILHSNYWMQVKRMDWRVTETVIDGVPVRVGIYDRSCNGLLEVNTGDKILTCSPGEPVTTLACRGAVKFSDTTLLKVNGRVYQVSALDPLGRYISIKPSKLTVDRLVPGDLVPDFAFVNIDSTSATLYEKLSTEKYNLIYLWGTWCAPCTSTLPLLKEVAETYQDRLNVIAFNAGDYSTTIRKYLEKHEVVWYNGMATSEIVKDLMVDAWPYYALIGKDKKIVRLYISLDELKQVLAD